MQFRYDAKTHRLTIEVDCSPERVKAASASKSGKTRLLDTTGSFISVTGDGVPAGLKVAANITLPNG